MNPTVKSFIISLTFAVFMFNVVNLYAQDDENSKRAQLESQKVSFITRMLNLSVAEAQKFWPVYNEYQQKNQEIIKKRRELFAKLRINKNQLSDDELTKISDQYIQLQIDEAKLASEYHTKFKEVLSISKVVAYYRAEEQFKIWLLNEVRKKQGEPGNN
jgi:hypothetical protein